MNIGPDTPAIVVGGASGLGAAVARHLAQSGAPVGILDLNAGGAQAVADEIGGHGVAADVTDPDSLATALLTLRKAQGQERILICCAGIAPAAKTVSRGAPHDAALFARVLNVNVAGTFTAASQSAAGMAGANPMGPDAERGVIVMTSSIAAYEGQMGQVAYGASKGAVAAMVLPMARDLASHGIRVMAIAPWVFATPMVTSFPQDVQDALARTSEFPRRLGAPREFAELATSIVGNAMLNGSVIRLDAATRMTSK